MRPRAYPNIDLNNIAPKEAFLDYVLRAEKTTQRLDQPEAPP
jgi:hypothetical protein